MPKYGVKGQVPEHLRAQPGRALCFWGDAGWGGMVRQGKYQDKRFGDSLVEACVRLMIEWNPEPAPRWVSCIPSLRHPALVQDFAQRLAARMELPFHNVLIKVDQRLEQKTMANSVQQARNVDGAFSVACETLPPGPLLLFDDMVDSGWTLTVATWLLRAHGSGEIWPLVLAQAGYQ